MTFSFELKKDLIRPASNDNFAFDLVQTISYSLRLQPNTQLSYLIKDCKEQFILGYSLEVYTDRNSLFSSFLYFTKNACYLVNKTQFWQIQRLTKTEPSLNYRLRGCKVNLSGLVLHTNGFKFLLDGVVNTLLVFDRVRWYDFRFFFVFYN